MVNLFLTMLNSYDVCRWLFKGLGVHICVCGSFMLQHQSIKSYENTKNLKFALYNFLIENKKFALHNL